MYKIIFQVLRSASLGRLCPSLAVAFDGTWSRPTLAFFGEMPRLSDMEESFVAWLRSQVTASPQLPLALDDDASLFLDPANERLVTTTDLLCEDVHFRLNETSLQRVGRKALAVNLSDLAAMAAQPRLAFVSIAWPHDRDPLEARELYRGLLDLAKQFGVELGGGDTNRWHGKLVISVTAIGQGTSRGVLRRGTAKVGDAILVTGPLGGSILGHHFDFEPRVSLALDLNARYTLHAGMDISDGLSLDLSRMVEMSGVGAELVLDSIPIADDARQLSVSTGRTPLEHALSDGEDFELLITAPQDEATRILNDTSLSQPVFRVGEIIAGEGIWYRDASGQRHRMSAEGYRH